MHGNMNVKFKIISYLFDGNDINASPQGKGVGG